jgi:hypothetical protein
MGPFFLTIARAFAWMLMFVSMVSGNYIVAGALLVLLLGTST